ncbi:matrilin-2-like, partial [Saccostrea echinata]|uniref:matrilin-2-like n=1 Tax=Saccostrea echinata TaxID=191078 RepID=UPI002A7EACD5
ILIRSKIENMGAFSIFVTLLLVSVVCAVDKTREDGARGSAVVEAVVDLLRERCIISDDNFYLRRMAYAASRDGEKSDTYLQGFHGGIWQINQQKFLLTQTSYNLRNQRNGIQRNFSINWSRVTWSDLRKPLYSGIAAALYVQYVRERYRTTIPSTIDAQALFWTKEFGGQRNDFLAVNNLRQVSCDMKPVDLVFVVDESTSIGKTNFNKMKNFLENLVDQITISNTAFRVGLVKFHTSATTVFDLNTYSQKSSIKRAIQNMSYVRGGTSIGEGIKSGRTVFSRSSRKDATKVMILLTDGQSKNKTLTAQEANRAKSKGVSIFVIGIGDVDREEITSAASEPTCVHVFMLQGFSGISNILYDVKRRSCKAPKKVKVDNETTVVVDLKPNRDVEDTVEIDTKAQVTVITANVTCGEVELFASAQTSTPSEVFYDVKGVARDNEPASFSIKNRGRTVFVHYKGKVITTMVYCKTINKTFSITFNQATDECKRKPCKNGAICIDLLSGFTCQCASGYTGRLCEKEVNMCESSPCQNWGTCSKNGNGYRCYCASGFTGKNCEVNIDDCTPNPCRNGGSCSDLVNNFRCSCPNGYTGKACDVTVNHCRSSSCENGGSCINSPSGFSCYCQTGFTGSNCENGIVQQSNSKCIPMGNIYHIPYPKDKTKFIQCDEFGGSFVMPCAPGTQFNKDYQTCVPRKTVECPRAGYYTFADPRDPGRYYQCSNGVSYLRSCPGGLVFDDNHKSCTWPTSKRQQTEYSTLTDGDDEGDDAEDDDDDIFDDNDDAMESERDVEEGKIDATDEKQRMRNLEKLKEVFRNLLDDNE